MRIVASPKSIQTTARHSQPGQNPPKRRRESTTEQDTDPDAEPLLSPPRSTSRGPSSRKRQKLRQAEASGASQPALVADGGQFLRPPEFWDNLSYTPLVKAALREHDRRNKSIPLPEPGRPRLIDSSVQRYARHGGPDLSDLRWLPAMPRDHKRPEPTRNSGGVQKRRARGGRGRNNSGSRSASTSAASSAPTYSQSNTVLRSADRSSHATSKTKSSSPYDAAFKQSLIDGAVWPIGHVLSSTLDRPPPPDNLDEIRSVICGNSRASLEPPAFTDQDWKRFSNAHDQATSEEARSRLLEGIIEGAALGLDVMNVKRGPIILTNLLPLLPNLVPGNPDRAYGARAETLHKSVRDTLGKVILPTTALAFLCPNFILHVKGPKGSSDTAGLQAVYDGALAARGIDTLYRWGSDGEGSGDGDGQGNIARTITCTYTPDGVLRMFAVHSRRSQTSTSLLQEQDTSSSHGLPNVEYITTRIGGWFMSESLEHFREGAAAFRNGMEWARTQRDEAIRRANQRARAIHHAQVGPATDAACEHLPNVASSAASEHHRNSSPASGYQSSADPLATCS